MPVDLHKETGGRVLVVKLTDKLTKEDYEDFIPEVERLVMDHGRLRILIQIHDFHGWTAGALWQDISYVQSGYLPYHWVKFDLKQFRDIERLALVGEKAWEHDMALFCKPFTSATIRYFDRSCEADQAHAWIHAKLLVAQG
jgi:SpoIIAA-like